MEQSSQDLRSEALQKIATLSAATKSKSGPRNLSKLYSSSCHKTAEHEAEKPSVFRQESLVTVSELQSLLALCRALPLLSDEKSILGLAQQLSNRLEETPLQFFVPSPQLVSISPSPHELLTLQLTRALLAAGIRHPKLHAIVLRGISGFLRNISRIVQAGGAEKPTLEVTDDHKDSHQRVEIAGVSLCLLGFLEAAADHCDFFAAEERLDLLRQLRRFFNEDFMVAVEGTFSYMRTSSFPDKFFTHWKIYNKRYATQGRPLGAMILQCYFMRFLRSCSSLQICTPRQLRAADALDVLLSAKDATVHEVSDCAAALVQMQSDIAKQFMRLLDDGADFLRLGSAWQQRLAFTTKSYTLQTFLICMVINEEIADIDLLLSWLEDAMADLVQMADETLASVVLRSIAVVAKSSSSTASALRRSLPRFIVQGGMQAKTVIVAARSLAYVLRLLSPDAVITGIYSLGNVLSAGSNADRATGGGEIPNGTIHSKHNGRYSQHSLGSAISLDLSGEEETSTVYGNVIRAIVTMANSCQDQKIVALAQTMLLQKYGKLNVAVDIHIVNEVAQLSLSSRPAEFNALLKLYNRMGHEAVVRGNEALLASLKRSQNFLATSLPGGSPLYQIFLVHLLETIVSKGDIHEGQNSLKADTEIAAREIVELIPILATLCSSNPNKIDDFKDDEYITRLQREAWFNIIVHGIVPGSTYGGRVSEDLQTLASHTSPLIAANRVEYLESDIELNTVLRRGMNAPNTAEQKRRLMQLLPHHETDVRSLSYPKVIFSLATHLVETSRAASGKCSDILTYFLDPSLNGTAMKNCISAIADEVINVYLRKILAGPLKKSAIPDVAGQLALFFTGCCHRIPRVQQIASMCADRIINRIPSALCQQPSLFALLELLSLMWTSCLEAELDEYGLKAIYSSKLGGVEIELSDDYNFRRTTLDALYKRSKGWLTNVISLAPLDVKGLLQIYLSEYDDEGAYGHVSLGRSFALELGSLIPATDQKLGAIERHGEAVPNNASDFIAQYTTRQEYKYADILPSYDKESAQFLKQSKQHRSTGRNHILLPVDGLTQKPPVSEAQEVDDDEAMLDYLGHKALEKGYIPIGELRDLLRRAAALLCRSKCEQCNIAQHLVELPFINFTKQSIKLGISLWLGVINENPSMEPRILAVIAQEWEKTVRNRMGVFSLKLRHPDPFYLKEEFAPSEKAVVIQQQQAAHNLIAPHLRLLQFLTSHFNANRSGSPHTQQIFHRLIIMTLAQLKILAGHPLAREIHFQFVSFGLNIFKFCAGLDEAARWRLMDVVLSAGLAWFDRPPKWSFGGNRLQIKTEVKLMADVVSSLRAMSSYFAKTAANFHALKAKQELLVLLLENEQMRLVVWLFPLDHEKRHFFSHSSGKVSDAILSNLVKVAWSVHPGLMINLTNRFTSEKVAQDVRSILLKQPVKALDEPDALQIMIGASLPPDVASQLKFLLYWAPVNPVTAVTYFLPEYQNHPFIIQYAMRALESHSVDVTFFYVPQIVQTLRYDVLGYVQRYILETAKFSQLFAHQIIWNMTANAYKDEDSSIEDSLKPTLDTVKDRMINSFSGADKVFYEREFSFFGEVTDISGKLRPFIKKSKPEKKQKIEEELRKITVEVGVYLPSNPDGTVIGIDRKSGKPLQSHAKAPFLATFRIKKEKGDANLANDLVEEAENAVKTKQNTESDNTYEVWQSAIFKVGDDCRQDVLALQMIAAFRGIFNDVGLEVYVYPYRVTATAPGCGVIDVLPNSISRDMLGREAVNGLYEYFISKYGTENSIRFQEARNNFVKSMAAYSVISYLLQFKDRHNGNIMIDEAGHILHIDFGFCFDIAPGGVRFERAPFKLTSEMVAVMGGSTSSQPYKWFEELCIKAFLASRPYADKLCHIVVLMLGSGLPCFKPETIAHLRQRFVLEKTEREAAEFMKDLIRKSYGSYSTKGYDQFQLLTNGIPY